MKAVDTLLNHGADPFHLDCNRQTILYYLAKNGKIFSKTLGHSRMLEKLLS